ncbi:MAG: phosphoribosylformylglycinamidine cyclo-ligase [Chlorobi bacterium]|nr:phosphoribosylformylglycinamidine cyclo-ligase [Chlorobiota bacterium]MCI0715338.1 phosphoribosylformylglycinamidine cyclo-ligase [Chlorobiota bacterium]
MYSAYSSSGVNINEGDRFVKIIKPLIKSTFTKNVLGGIGNFGAFFKIPENFKSPVFVSSTDSVGTKIKVAIASGRHETVGEDIVNHSVNDIAVCGAVPLFCLDYLAFGKLRAKIAKDIVRGLVRGCKKNNCSLIGGETAEMPDIYDINDYDIAATVIGVVEKKRIIDNRNVKSGDILIGLASNGLHTNGYSLARKVLLKKFKLNSYIPELNTTLLNELLKVHKSYLNIIQGVTKNFNVHSISHITGGGIIGNTKRVVPKNLKIKVDWNSWKRNQIFNLIQKTGKISEAEMRKVFNLGIGLILIVSKNDTNRISNYFKRKKEKHFIIGEITK